MSIISWADFAKIDIRVGTIVRVESFPQAHKPAYILHVDLGDELGIKKSSAQVTKRYQPADLMNKKVLCVVNFPEKQIGPIKSQVLVTGVSDGEGGVILATAEGAPNGSRLY